MPGLPPWCGSVRGMLLPSFPPATWGSSGQRRSYLKAQPPRRRKIFGRRDCYAAAISFRPEGGASFSTYAGVFVYNRMTSAVRRHVSSGNRPLNESVPLEDAGDAAVEAGPEDLLELREDFRTLQQRMGVSLSPLERRVLALYLNGYRRGEAANRAGITVRAYDNALHRVRSKLKRL